MEVEDVIAWGWAFEKQNRRVALTQVTGNIRVSTVFLGLDHNFSPLGPPLLFETMIFGGPHDQYQDRYSTWEEAEQGHLRAVVIAEGEVDDEGEVRDLPEAHEGS